jgi:hypothetical protein
MLSDDITQARLTIAHVREMLDAVVVRGVRAVAGEQLRELRSLAEEMNRIGAAHVGALLSELAGQIDQSGAKAPQVLMTAISHARVLDRLLTLRAVNEAYRGAIGGGDG